MDWTNKVDSAKRQIDKYGAAMYLVTSIGGSYSATADSISSTTTTYSILAVITNPTVQRGNGEWGKSDRVRLLVAAKGLPTNLDELEYKVVYGATVWNPEVTASIKPGGVPILFIIDMK